MTCLKDRVLCGARMKFHTPILLGTFFVYTLGLCMLKKSFLKIGILSPKVYTKNVPNIERSMKFHPWPAQNSVFQASHCSALLIECILPR